MASSSPPLVALAPRSGRCSCAGARSYRPRSSIVDPEGAPTIDADGAARSVQAAELTIPADALVELWTPATLERLARTYWRFLERCSLGLIRVRYSEHERAVVLLCRPLVLIALRPARVRARRGPRPRALADPRRRACLPPPGRRGGFLQIDVRRLDDSRARLPGDPRRGRRAQLLPGDRERALATGLYAATQSAIHVTVTHGFLRSLARLDLAQSRTGRFRDAALGVSRSRARAAWRGRGGRGCAAPCPSASASPATRWSRRWRPGSERPAARRRR